MKHKLRKDSLVQTGDNVALEAGLVRTLAALPAEHCDAWFRHCGWK